MNTTAVPVIDMDTLLRQGKEHQAFIDAVKAQVCEPIDNINKPVPLFSQLNLEAQEGE